MSQIKSDKTIINQNKSKETTLDTFGELKRFIKNDQIREKTIGMLKKDSKLTQMQVAKKIGISNGALQRALDQRPDHEKPQPDSESELEKLLGFVDISKIVKTVSLIGGGLWLTEGDNINRTTDWLVDFIEKQKIPIGITGSILFSFKKIIVPMFNKLSQENKTLIIDLIKPSISPVLLFLLIIMALFLIVVPLIKEYQSKIEDIAQRGWDATVGVAEDIIGKKDRAESLKEFIASDFSGELYRNSPALTRFFVDDDFRPIFPITDVLNLPSFEKWLITYPVYKALTRSNNKLFNTYKNFIRKARNNFAEEAKNARPRMWTSSQWDEVFRTNPDYIAYLQRLEGGEQVDPSTQAKIDEILKKDRVGGGGGRQKVQ